MRAVPALLSHSLPARRRGLLSRIADALAIRRERDQLARLEPHLLKDIGLTPCMAEIEASRPLWDVPPHWKR